MENNLKVYGVAGLFSSPDEIIKAAEAVSDSQYKNYDIHTPYPVHGMDKAMKLPPSKLGFITLVFGLTGTAVALLFMYWAMSVSYPMVIGGKPFFAFPAFIPVTFEVTVLLATLATVIGMLTFFFKFPDNAHPLHDTGYMRQVSKDKFGVWIGAQEDGSDTEQAAQFLRSLGAYTTEIIYFPEKKWQDAFSPRFLWFLAAVAIVTCGGTYIALNKVLINIPFTWMSNQDRLNAQSTSTFFKDGKSMRIPVSGTVARGHIPYLYKDLKTQPAVPLKNPAIAGIASLSAGKKNYEVFCSPCHGYLGDGDSRLREQFPKPPSLHTAKLRGWEDGNIYHVIMAGQNVMPSYASQISNEDAWSIVNYVRVLQKAKNASVDEIKQFKKEAPANVAK